MRSSQADYIRYHHALSINKTADKVWLVRHLTTLYQLQRLIWVELEVRTIIYSEMEANGEKATMTYNPCILLEGLRKTRTLNSRQLVNKLAVVAFIKQHLNAHILEYINCFNHWTCRCIWVRTNEFYI
jgi:hypothetical protein